VRRLQPLDAVLLVVLVPLWLGCFALHVNEVARGRLAWVPVFVSPPEDTDGYPTVRAFWPGTGAEASGLVIGDRLIRVGEADLRGAGPIGFVAWVYEEVGQDLRLSVAFVRAGERGEAWLSLHPVSFPWRILPLILGLAVTGVLAFLRAPGSRPARAYFLASVTYSLHWALFFGGPRVQTYAWVTVSFCSSLVMFPLVLRTVMLLPEELAPTGARLPAWPWLFAVMGPIWTSGMFGVPLPPLIGLRAIPALSVAFTTTLLVLLTRNFRRAGPVGRRQLKWVVYGIYIGAAPVLAADVVIAIAPRFWWLHDVSMIATVLIPICIFIALVRFNLFDIDRLISATAAYTILSVLLVAAALTMIPRLSQAASSTVGIDAAFGQLVSSLLLAALVVPGQRYLRPQIERLFFVERYALEQGVERLLRELSACAGPQALLTLAGEQLDALLRPECCVLYGRAGATYAPVFMRGSAVPPAFDANSSLVAVLQTHAIPIEVEQWQRRTTGVPLAPADRAVLDSLGAAVLLPVGRHAPLTAFVCLGHKRSGDVYTSTDLALLAAVADKISGELQRFDEAEIHRQAQAMQAALRRYVPEPVAARVMSGQELEAGEREISVLFVDIRGYTTYSEGRTTAENFSMINRYTETVSRVVQQHDGMIVEFTGDGVMAVFGAPEPLMEKERCAVAAGREIVAAVRSLALGREHPESRPLEVGVGIATGKAFVGTIQSVDRLIWTAIGNTPNLGARLQSLSRELNAAIVIDAATWMAAGALAADFERHAHTPIRGRRQTEDVYALPLAAPAVRSSRSSAASV
jgi:class 3 adenylate cyclase